MLELYLCERIVNYTYSLLTSFDSINNGIIMVYSLGVFPVSISRERIDRGSAWL